MPGVGAKTREILESRGFHTIGDFQKLPLDQVIQGYGMRGYALFLSAYGKDNRPVDSDEHAAKSIGAETTFDRDQKDMAFLKESLTALTKRVSNQLVKNKTHTRAICLKLRDHHFRTITRSRVLFADTQDEKTINKAFLDLFEENYRGEVPLRLIGVSLKKLAGQYWQPTLF